MWRHGSFKPGIFVPKVFLATHQRRSGNWSAEKKGRKKSRKENAGLQLEVNKFAKCKDVHYITNRNYLRINKHDGRKHPLVNTDEILAEFLCF